METKELRILKFIYDRLIHVHGENENVDYMINLRQIIKDKEITKINVKKKDLINLIKGTSPSYELMNEPIVQRHGYFVGGFVDEWKWKDSLENLTEQVLYELYLKCENSWKNNKTDRK